MIDRLGASRSRPDAEDGAIRRLILPGGEVACFTIRPVLYRHIHDGQAGPGRIGIIIVHYGSPENFMNMNRRLFDHDLQGSAIPPEPVFSCFPAILGPRNRR
jgi:hypothetical protein